MGEAERAIRRRERAAARGARRSYRERTSVKSPQQKQEEAEHWRRWAEFESLVRQAIEALRKAGWPNPDRILKVGPFNVRRAAWTLTTWSHSWGENSYGTGGSAVSPSSWLLSDGRIATNVDGDKIRRVLPVSWWRQPTHCMSSDYQEMVRNLRALISLPPR